MSKTKFLFSVSSSQSLLLSFFPQLYFLIPFFSVLLLFSSIGSTLNFSPLPSLLDLINSHALTMPFLARLSLLPDHLSLLLNSMQTPNPVNESQALGPLRRLKIAASWRHKLEWVSPPTTIHCENP